MTWYLESVGDDRGAWRTEISPLPFRVGRRESCHLKLNAPSISAVHAQLDVNGRGSLMLEDLSSTNGSFVNLQRVEGTTEAVAGDVIHFADVEFRVVGEESRDTIRSTAAVSPAVIEAMRGAAERRSALESFIKTRNFAISFQPIVCLETGEVFAFEALGRSVVREFFETVDEMFSEAARLEMSLELSEALRFVTSEVSQDLPAQCPVFINTHPHELKDPARLLRTIDDFSDAVDDRRVVLEIHEMAITDVAEFSVLRQELADREVGLAFDDFGRGQSRFLELADLSPEYVKFDRATIAGADEKGSTRSQLMQTLVGLVERMGHRSIAEGIETEEELEFCRQLGFDYGQGYLLGRPRPSDEPPTLDRYALVR